ncbi:MAG: hypothetical protein Q4E45_12500, partial [Eubacteriales bacterium]|nr:hypothetical protein [Eubacteriales bacterium]
IVYPSEETLARGESFLYQDAETSHLMDSLWLEVKTEGDVDYGPILGICATAALVGGYLIIHSVREKRRKARRCRKWRGA